MWYERRVDTMLSRLSRRGMASVSLRMTGAPITGPVLTEGVGYVEASDDKRLAVGDRVFATKLRGAWGGEAAGAQAGCTENDEPSPEEEA